MTGTGPDGAPDDPHGILTFPDGDALRLLEAHGLTGTWAWNFVTDEYAWSPGLFRLLGLAPGAVRPGYHRFMSFVHPDDRAQLETGTQMMREGVFTGSTFRVIRADGAVRLLTGRSTIYVTPEGRPRAGAGVVLDMTEPEFLAASHRENQRRRRALFAQTQTWIHTLPNAPHASPVRVASWEIMSLTGVTQQAFQENWTLIFAPEERARADHEISARFAAGRPFAVEQTLALARGDRGLFRSVAVPVRGDDGRIETWATLNGRVDGPRPVPSGIVRQGLEQAVQAAHLRAARGLVGWSMADLAGASGLSLSTVRRLEEGGEGPASRSRHAAVAALRRAGIGFVVIDGDTLAVVKVR